MGWGGGAERGLAARRQWQRRTKFQISEGTLPSIWRSAVPRHGSSTEELCGVKREEEEMRRRREEEERRRGRKIGGGEEETQG